MADARPPDRFIELRIGNYRCFPASSQAVFTFRPGFAGLIGPNNAGKSTLLKFLYEFRNVFTALPNNLETAVRGVAVVFAYPPEITDMNEVAARAETGDIWIRLRTDGYAAATSPAIVPDSVVFRIRRGANDFTLDIYRGGVRLPFNQNAVAPQGNGVVTQGDTHVDLGPVLAAAQSLSRSLYIGPFRNAINIGTNTQYYDLQIGQSFISQWRQLQTGTARSANEATEQLNEDIRTVFGFERLRIMPTNDNDTLVLLINGASRRLNEVGAGLAQFIVCVTNAAVKRPDWVLIDEPEMNLHPKLQPELLKMLATFAGEGIAFATHSLGLARANAGDLYTLRQVSDGVSQVAAYSHTPRLTEFLGELGYESLREIGFDRLLLVEGPTDLVAVKELLRKFGKEAKVVVFHLGGGDRTAAMAAAELAEVKQITDRVSVLIDSEKNSAEEALAPSRQTLVDACASAQVEILVLQRRAIENYFTSRAINSAVGEGHDQLGPYERLKDSQGSWGKQNNWRIAAAMTKEELAGTDLGEFLQRI